MRRNVASDCTPLLARIGIFSLPPGFLFLVIFLCWTYQGKDNLPPAVAGIFPYMISCCGAYCSPNCPCLICPCRRGVFLSPKPISFFGWQARYGFGCMYMDDFFRWRLFSKVRRNNIVRDEPMACPFVHRYIAIFDLAFNKNFIVMECNPNTPTKIYHTVRYDSTPCFERRKYSTQRITQQMDAKQDGGPFEISSKEGDKKAEDKSCPRESSRAFLHFSGPFMF